MLGLYTNIAIENGHLYWIYPLKMVIYHIRNILGVYTNIAASAALGGGLVLPCPKVHQVQLQGPILWLSPESQQWTELMYST